MPTARVRAYTLPKAGSPAAEYEDAWAADADAGVYAVADGASSSAFAGEWAQALVTRFVAAAPPMSCDPAGWTGWIAPAQAAWQAAEPADLPWYVAAKRRAGAFATFVGLRLEAGGDLAAWAVGDSCLFHIPAMGGAGPERSPAAGGFPLDNAAAFGAHPWALASVVAANTAVWPHVATTHGVWQPGDQFILASDALAQWLLRFVVSAGTWASFLAWLAIADDSAFAAWVDEQRSSGALRDDDITLLWVDTPTTLYNTGCEGSNSQP